jgi:HEAT repeat protein
MSPEYSADEAARLMVAAFEANDPESVMVAVQVARLAGVSTADLSAPIVARNRKGLPFDAAVAAGRHGAIDLLLRLVSEAHWEVRGNAATALGRVGGPAAREALQRAADDPDNWVQICANRALDALAQAPPIADPGALTRRGRAIAALHLGDPGRADFVDIALLLDHPSKVIRKASREAIRHGGPPARDALFHALPGPRPLSLETITFLGELGDARAFETLLRAVPTGRGHREEDEAWSAVLQKFAPPGDAATASRIATVFTSSVGAGGSSAAPDGLRRVLRRYGAAAADHLVEAYRTTPQMRRGEGQLIGEIAGASAIPLLLDAFDDVYRDVRVSAAAGLAAVGAAAVPFVLDLYRPEAPEERRRDILRILSRIADARALPVLLDGLHHRSAAVRADAGEGLIHVGAPAVPHLVAMLESPAVPLPTRELVVELLGRIGEVGRLETLLRSADPSIRRTAFSELQRVWGNTAGGGDVIVRALLPVLEDPESDLLDAVIAYLVREGRKTLAPLTTARESASGIVATRVDYALQTIADEIRDRVDRLARISPGSPRYGDPGPSEEMHSFGMVREPQLPSRELPFPITDAVRFSVSAPLRSAAGETFLLGIWIHQSTLDIETLAARQQRGRETHVDSRGPVPLARGAAVSVHVSVPDYGIEGLNDTILWTGGIGNCSFPIAVPPEATAGIHLGRATFRVGDIIVSRLDFALDVGPALAAAADVTSREARFQRAFASYSSEDRERVMGRIQGMLKILPELDIFLDVLSLRSGERWEARITEEILSRDAFLLFWSLAASQSTWVEREWKTALQHKGLDAISPVPLDPPTVAPPPSELAALHFWDPGLALGR